MVDFCGFAQTILGHLHHLLFSISMGGEAREMIRPSAQQSNSLPAALQQCGHGTKHVLRFYLARLSLFPISK